MPFNSSTRSNTKVVLEGHEPEHVIRGTHALSTLTCHTAHLSMEILVQETKITNAWTQALENRNAEEADNVYGDIKIEDN